MKNSKVKTKMTKFLAVSFIFWLVIFSGNLFAKEKELQVNLTGYGLFTDGFMPIPGGMISLGCTGSEGFGFELGAVISLNGGVLFMGNILASPFDLNPVNPYLMVGTGTSIFGGFLINTSAGIRTKLASNIALLLEYQRWFVQEESIGLVRAGEVSCGEERG